MRLINSELEPTEDLIPPGMPFNQRSAIHKQQRL
jgi:hypothetical protein